MIKNYGLLWQRKYVHLGAGSNRGTLLGRHPKIKEVDFREQIGIYILYDKDLIPVYVGQAGNGNATLFSRLKKHTSDHLWNRWEYFSWFGLRGVNADNSLTKNDSITKVFKSKGSSVLNELEGVLIAAIEPKLNKQGPRLPEASEFSQEVDENITELTFADIKEEIGNLKKQMQSMHKKIGKNFL